MKRIFIFLVGIFSSISGSYSISETVQPSSPPVSRRIDDGTNFIGHPPTNSLLPITSTPNTALLAAQDGMVYLVELNSGNILWSFKSGPPIYASYQALDNYDTDEGDNYNSSEPIEFFLDYGEDGNLYMQRPNSKKEKIPLTAEEFISRTPVVTADGGIILGSKNTTVFLIDPTTGKVIYSFKSGEHPSENTLDAKKNPIILKDEFKKLLESRALDFKHKDQSLYVLRKDYTIKYFSRKTGKSLWYLTFSDIEASLQCQEISSFGEYSSSPEDDVDSERKDSPKWPFNCASSTVVHKIRDNNLLESLLLRNGLPNQQHLGGRILPLPATDAKPGVKTDLLALPHSEMQSGVLALPANDSGKNRSTTSGPKFLNGYLIWTFFMCASTAAFTLYLGRTGKGIAEQNVKTVPMKKKKTRKSGTKNGPITKKINENTLKLQRVGKVLVSNKEIAKGSNGTVVLEGMYDGRPVAVKRLLKSHYNSDVAWKEIKKLIVSDRHPNIVRWIGVDYDEFFTYMSLERCTCNLGELICLCSASCQNQAPREDQEQRMMQFLDIQLWKPNSHPSAQLLKLLRDIVSGLSHLHELGIVHRDLKPQNILIINERSISAKISDMGISKCLSENMSSMTQTTTGNGSSGWQAPEQLSRERQTRAIDLFSLGCIFFFCLTGGKHPFGDIFERDVNILNGRKDLFLLESNPEAIDIIDHLLDPNPDLRPKAMQVMHHPFFWNSEMRLSFLRDASDRVELEIRECESEVLNALESISTLAFGGNKWDERIDGAIINNLGRYRRYNFNSVRDLLRVIRNKLNHYRELSPEVERILGPVPDGFNNYFSTRFPRLLMEVYKVLCRYCSEEVSLQRYFGTVL